MDDIFDNLQEFDWLERCPALRGQVKDQEQYNICWAIACAFCVGAQHTIRTGVRTIVSPQDLINSVIHTYPEGAPVDDEGIIFDTFNCYGMIPEYVFMFIRKYGIAYEVEIPFLGPRTMLDPPVRNLEHPRVYIQDYKILRGFADPSVPLTEHVAFTALRDGGPMMGTLYATNEFQNYKGGIISQEADEDNDDPHSVVIVGMNKTLGCFKIQNSYGTKWGVEEGEENGDGTGWILYHLVFDIIQPVMTTEYPVYPCMWGGRGPRSARRRRRSARRRSERLSRQCIGGSGRGQGSARQSSQYRGQRGQGSARQRNLGMDVNEKIEILKSEFQKLLKKGQDWVQHLSVEMNKQELFQKLPPFIQNIPPLQLYVAFVVLFLTMFLFFIVPIAVIVSFRKLKKLAPDRSLIVAARKDFSQLDTLNILREESKKSKLAEPANDIPRKFWSYLLLMVGSWYFEKKFELDNASLLREMIWKRDGRIRDAYMECKEKNERETITTFLGLISSADCPGLHVIHIAAEMAPVAKVGGLGSAHQGTVTSMEPNEGSFVLHLETTKKGKNKPVHLVDVPVHSRLQIKLDDFLPQAAGVVVVVDAVEFLPKSRAVSEYLYDILTKASVVKKNIQVLILCNKVDKVTANTKKFIRKQLEKEMEQPIIFFFSSNKDENLKTDNYLVNYVTKDKDGYVPISVIASFRKLKKLAPDRSLIVAARKDFSQLVLSSSKKSVRRLDPLPFNEVRDPQLFTVLVENLPEDHSPENIRKIFCEAGNIKNISIRMQERAREEVLHIFGTTISVSFS